MAKCYMMIGVPGSGKSTHISELQKTEMIRSVSSDEYLDNVAKKMNLKYSDVYKDHISDAIKWMNSEIRSLMDEQKDFIWDQTNLNPKARKDKINLLISNGYEIEAICFETEKSVVMERVQKRAELTGKRIPKEVMNSMFLSYQQPTHEEGFSRITLHNGFGQFIELPKQEKTKHNSLHP